MKDQIAAILRGEGYPNVYLLDRELTTADLEKLDRVEGTKLFAIDGSQINDCQSLFQQFATVMQFPAYFGHNWDALKDCLTELDGYEVDRYIITIDRLEKFINNDPSQWKTLLDVCKSVVEYWQDTDTPMSILLSGNSDLFTRTDSAI
jgi:RNAse (barnase) inhibitor barstar